MLDAIKKRLDSWGNKYISLGGRIVLINAVLNALPIFFLFYIRMPTKVWKEVVKIQRNFFWRRLSQKRRMCWVKWEDICKPKKEGGLGVKNLCVMNLSLLAKWRWKLLLEGNELWKKVVMAKYGSNVVGNVNLEEFELRGVASVWWRDDVCRMDRGVGWFAVDEILEGCVG
jgi:hypothetical protein